MLICFKFNLFLRFFRIVSNRAYNNHCKIVNILQKYVITLIGVHMNIELRFLQKAIEDKNFVSFSYSGKNYKKVKPLKLENQVLKCDIGQFEHEKLSKIKVLKEKF